MKDSTLMRAKDISIILGILMIVGYLFKISSHVTHWDDMVIEMQILKPIVAADSASIMLLQTRFDYIKQDLEEIKKNTRGTFMRHDS